MRHSNRKLFLFGRYSIALLLPKKWLSEFGAGPGQDVVLEFDASRKRIIVRPQTSEETTATKPKPPKPISKTVDLVWYNI
jgi:bifunctional DNA-binding transcriptional regulator/antitoxin component of YhaV-PrlF toxin-antitoxin module